MKMRQVHQLHHHHQDNWLECFFSLSTNLHASHSSHAKLQHIQVKFVCIIFTTIGIPLFLQQEDILLYFCTFKAARELFSFSVEPDLSLHLTV